MSRKSPAETTFFSGVIWNVVRSLSQVLSRMASWNLRSSSFAFPSDGIRNRVLSPSGYSVSNMYLLFRTAITFRLLSLRSPVNLRWQALYLWAGGKGTRRGQHEDRCAASGPTSFNKPANLSRVHAAPDQLQNIFGAPGRLATEDTILRTESLQKRGIRASCAELLDTNGKAM